MAGQLSVVDGLPDLPTAEETPVGGDETEDIAETFAVAAAEAGMNVLTDRYDG